MILTSFDKTVSRYSSYGQLAPKPLSHKTPRLLSQFALGRRFNYVNREGGQLSWELYR